MIRIARNEGRREVILEKWQKGLMFAYFFLFFVFTVALYSVYAFNSMNKPILDLRNIRTSGFIAMFVIVAILSSIAIFVVVVLYIKIGC